MDLIGTLKNIPWWGYAAGGGVALAGGYYIVKSRQSSTASTPASQVSSSPIPAGLNAADLAGLPLDYQDYDSEYAADTAASATNDTPTAPPPSNPGVSGYSVPGASPYPQTANAIAASMPAGVQVPGAAPFPQGPVPSPNPTPPPASPLPQGVSIPSASPFGQLHEHAVWDEWVTPAVTGGTV